MTHFGQSIYSYKNLMKHFFLTFIRRQIKKIVYGYVRPCEDGNIEWLQEAYVTVVNSLVSTLAFNLFCQLS